MPEPRQFGTARVSLSLVSKILGPSILTQAFGLGVAFFAQIVIARAIEAAQFGIYSFAMAIVSGAAIFGRFGWDSTVMRFGRSVNEGDRVGRLRSLFQTARSVVWRKSLITVGIVVLSGWVAWYFGAARLTFVSLLIGAAMIPIIAQSGVRQAVLLVAGNVWTALGPDYVLRPVLLLLGGLLLLAVHGTSAEFALVMALVASTATLLTSDLLVRRRSLAETPSLDNAEDRAEWKANARSTMLFNGAYQLLAYADLLVAGLLLPAEHLGYYAAARALAMMGTFALVAMQVAVGPSMSAALHRGDTHEVRGIAIAVARIAVVFAAAYALIVGVVGGPVLLLFGSGFDAAFPALMVLLGAQLVNAVAGPLGTHVTMSGLQREASVVYLVAVVVLAGSAIILSFSFGMLGIACSVLLATMTWTILLSRLLARRLGMSIWLLSRSIANRTAEPK